MTSDSRNYAKKSDSQASKIHHVYMGITLLHLSMTELLCVTPGEINDMVQIYNDSHGATGDDGGLLG